MNYKQVSCAGFFIVDPSGKFVLLGEDAHGYLSPQKGNVEPKLDDALFKCAIRETFEESGISIHELQFSAKEYMENADIYWLTKLKVPKQEFKFDPDELKSVEWYEIDTLLKSKTTTLKPQRLEILQQMVSDMNQVIWLDDVSEKRFFRHNPQNTERKKNPHDKEARSLVKLLRHNLDSQKIRYDGAGYVSVSDVVKNMKKLNLKTIQEIVLYDNTYDKQRLDLKFDANIWKIRANQGHSLQNLNEEELLTELFEPLPYCIHGTEKKFLASINMSGLNKMGRTHIHCIAKNPDATDFKDVISGFKKQSTCYIVIDMRASLTSGLRWFVSKNGVLLTEGPILPTFFIAIKEIV